ncbi:unnamed protein product [Auanema sp. JU1783]|nr:unnamed protein product [Auanema sp. JU1783]
MVEADLNKENEEMPSMSDPEDYVDSITNEELVPDVLRQKPNIDEYEQCCTVIFGIPSVGPERFPKLEAVLNKIFATVNSEYKIHIPQNDEGVTKGCVFIEWKDKESAEYAKGVLDGYKLDKNHTFSTSLFNDLVKVEQPPADWAPPQQQPFSDPGDLWWWMQNSRCRDQFAVHFEKNGVPTVGVYWHIKGHEPELAGDTAKAERNSWTETIFKWSPHGSYMTTVHSQGVILWGGPDYTRCQRFAHHSVQCVDFSPCEKYLVTYANPTEKMHWGNDDDCLRIWDVRTGELLKTFSLYALTNRNQLPFWPFFQWSHDEKYFACLKAPEKDKLEKEKKVNGISVFETEKFGLVDKRHVIIENIQSFQWSPTQNVIAYYSECTDSLPAEFGLMQVPTHSKLRSGRIYNVAEAQMFWQPNGKRLAVYTKRYSKKQTRETGEVKYVGGCSYHLEIFELDKKDVSLMNLPLPDPFINFGWEPNGDKFCVLTGNQAKATPHVYKIDSKSPHPLKLMSKLDAGVQFNEVVWAPSGGWLAVLAKLSTGGNVVFVDATLQEAKRTNVVEHPGFNKGVWDPTGRYFVTCTTLGGRTGADLAFRIYTFQGRELCRKNLDRLSQFEWRPRPPVKLSDLKLKEIKKNLKKTAVRFDREDNEEKYRASQEVVEKRRKIMAAFNLIRQKNLDIISSQKDKKIELRGGVDTDAKLNAEELVEEQITLPLSTEKTVASVAEDQD